MELGQYFHQHSHVEDIIKTLRALKPVEDGRALSICQEGHDFIEYAIGEMKRIRLQAGVELLQVLSIFWMRGGKLRDNAVLMLELDACVVASTYCNSWIFRAFDPEAPFESMARAYTELFIVRNDEEKEKYIDEMVRFFKIDGIIFHDAKTCPNNSNNRYGMPERYSKQKNVPALVINGDLNDLRCYSEEQARTNIEAFVEQLAERS